MSESRRSKVSASDTSLPTVSLSSSHGSTLEALGRRAIHPFPARMAPGIALEALGSSPQRLRVLDPMMGSGTVIAAARMFGHEAVGFDIDPLAVLLSRVWTRRSNESAVRKKAVEVLSRAALRSRLLSASEAYPVRSDWETQQFTKYWFDTRARCQLATLATAIAGVREVSTREVLWCAFSRLIITKTAGASLAMDLSHSRPHRAYKRAPVMPFDRFISAVDYVVKNCQQGDPSTTGPAPKLLCRDARAMRLRRDSFDMVVTSPPYLNAIDYMRCSKFSLVWMGYRIVEIRGIRGQSVGVEAASRAASKAKWVGQLLDELAPKPRLSSRYQGLLERYVWDMGKAIDGVSRVLRRGGRAVYVVGDSMSKGTFISNSTIIEQLAIGRGLRLDASSMRTLPSSRRYLPPPVAQGENELDGRMRREVVMSFTKV